MSEKKIIGFEMLCQEAIRPIEQVALVEKKEIVGSIGLPREIFSQETRIGLTPESVALLISRGYRVQIESGAGAGSKFSDLQYSEVGAQIVYSPQEAYKADVIVKIQPPTLEELQYFQSGQVLISTLQLGRLQKDFIQLINKKRITALAFEFIEDKLGGIPIIRAMSEIAGNVAVSVAAEHLSSRHQGQGIILGGITGVPPTKVVIIGAGTVAEFVARATLSMGAEIQVYDNNIYKLRRLKHMLGQQFYTSTIDNGVLGKSLQTADVLIGALRMEKGYVQHVVSEEMVSHMKSNAIIIDLSIDQGGCIATSKSTTLAQPTFKKHGVIHYCVPNVTSQVPRTAATALSNIITPMLARAKESGGIESHIYKQKGLMKGVYTYKGNLTNQDIARRLGMNFHNIELLLTPRF